MDDRIKSAFDGIHAEEQLKAGTLAFLHSKRHQAPRKNRAVGFRRLAVALMCVLALTLSGIFSYNIYFTEAMYLDVDINPSVELTVNRFDRIIAAHAYNADGEELLSQLSLMHKPYDSAIAELTVYAIECGFLSDGGLVSVTLQSGGSLSENVILNTLLTNIASAAQGHHALVQIDAFLVDSATKGYAHAQNLSPAKYLAILELLEVDPTATMEGCRSHSIQEIRDSTQQHGCHRHGEDSGVSETESPGRHGHHGNGNK